MTQSDLLTTAAVRGGTTLRMNGREVLQEGRVTVVTLHGKPCLRFDPSAGTLELDGATLPTRKSCRLFNAVLADKTRFRAFTREGKWFLEDPMGVRTAFTDRIATVPVIS